MSGPLANARQERFAQELAKGRSQSRAYELAGYSPSPTAAARLCRNVNVAARLVELKERAANRATITAADIARQLDEDRAFAITCKSPAAAVSATMGQAKVLGLIVDRHAGPTGGAIPLRFDLSVFTDEELEYLERVRSRLAIAGGNPVGEGEASG